MAECYPPAPTGVPAVPAIKLTAGISLEIGDRPIGIRDLPDNSMHMGHSQ